MTDTPSIGEIELGSPVGDHVWNGFLIAAVRVRSWLIGGVFTAGSLAVVTRPSGEILLVRPRYRRGWGLVGGFMKFGEQPADTMERELHEEVGIVARVDAPVVSYVQSRRRHIDHLFVIDVPQDASIRISGHLEIAGAAWYHPTALPSLQREAHEAFARLASTRTARRPSRG
jgi:ADP-ribose pyrophosphatase YjhB (NUDIX family)